MLSIAIVKETEAQIIFNDSLEILNFSVYLDLKKYIFNIGKDINI